MKQKKYFFSAIIGNILENYDTALFGLLAPYFAPLFFPKEDPLTALIIAYAMMPLGFLCRPLGALFFGSIGDRFGRKYALSFSLFGIALCTFLMGTLPVGIWISPWILCLCRILQSFFSAGESAGGAVFLLEKFPEGRKNFMSSLYDASTVIGILFASLLVYSLGEWGDLKELWRWPFFLAGLTAVIGGFIRFSCKEEPISSTPVRVYLKTSWKEKKLLLPIVIAAGFSYCTYSFSFPFLNSFLPIACDISPNQATLRHTLFLIIDLLLLPLFALLANRLTKEKLMGGAALLVAILSPLLFFLLPKGSSLWLQATIVSLGAAFASTYHSWAQERVPKEIRYSFVSLGTAMGVQLFGLPSIAVSLWLYQKTGWIWSPGIYLSAIAIAAAMCIVKPKKVWEKAPCVPLLSENGS